MNLQLHAKYQRKKPNQFWEKCVTNGRDFIGLSDLRTGVQLNIKFLKNREEHLNIEQSFLKGFFLKKSHKQQRYHKYPVANKHTWLYRTLRPPDGGPNKH